MDWYPFYPAPYRADTLLLSLAEHGAYRFLIDHYMLSGKPLPDNDAMLAKIVGVSPKEWARVASAVRAFFVSADGHLRHKRCDEEIARQRSRAARGRQMARKRWPNGADNEESDARP